MGESKLTPQIYLRKGGWGVEQRSGELEKVTSTRGGRANLKGKNLEGKVRGWKKRVAGKKKEGHKNGEKIRKCQGFFCS